MPPLIQRIPAGFTLRAVFVDIVANGAEDCAIAQLTEPLVCYVVGSPYVEWLDVGELIRVPTDLWFGDIRGSKLTPVYTRRRKKR